MHVPLGKTLGKTCINVPPVFAPGEIQGGRFSQGISPGEIPRENPVSLPPLRKTLGKALGKWKIVGALSQAFPPVEYWGNALGKTLGSVCPPCFPSGENPWGKPWGHPRIHTFATVPLGKSLGKSIDFAGWIVGV